MKTKLFTLLLAMVASTSMLFAESGTCGENLTWDLTDSVLTISGTGAMTDYTSTSAVPWYSSSQSIKSILLPDALTTIGNLAFSGCNGLTLIEIPNSVTSIGGFAFYGCTALTTIEIPNSVTSIGEWAFYNCRSLTSIEIPTNITSIGGHAFADCNSLASIAIPDGVTSIPYDAFSNCNSLTSLKLSANWVKDGNYNLYICGAVGNDGLYMHHLFEWMQRLEHIEAPAWFFDVNETFWAYCPTHIKTVVINNGEMSDNGFAVVRRSSKTLVSLDILDIFNTNLNDYAINGCNNLRSLQLPTNLEKIGYMSVSECVKLPIITLPASVTEIEDRAFENCRSLATVEFAEGGQLQTIGSWAFYNCHALQNLTIPEGVTEIGDGAFYGCTYLDTLSMPASVQSIGDNAFALCSKISQMDVDAVEPPAVEDKTFYEVSAEAPVYVPDESVMTYKAHPVWGRLNIIGKSAPQGIDNANSYTNAVKVLRDGQIFILRGDKTYTLQGQVVR